MEVEGVKSFRMHDGTVLLVFRDHLDSSMRCWPLPTLFSRMQPREDQNNAITYNVGTSPPSPTTSDCGDNWRETSLASLDECMQEIEALAQRHGLPLVAFPLHRDLQRMRLDLLRNSGIQAQDAASLLVRTRAALLLWGDV